MHEWLLKVWTGRAEPQCMWGWTSRLLFSCRWPFETWTWAFGAQPLRRCSGEGHTASNFATACTRLLRVG